MKRAKRRRVQVVDVRVITMNRIPASFPPPTKVVGNWLVWNDLNLSQFEQVPDMDMMVHAMALRARGQERR